ncbi:MAG TPA: hypothetical protein VKU02_19730 [Gemmataceae bacterium]|nr:hypothetical protein [Gemmataceae bacterium]
MISTNRNRHAQRDFRHFELPGIFARRYRPVRVHAHEKGLAAYALDEYGLRFFRVLATGASVPHEAVWSILRQPNGALQILTGRRDDACGFLVCEVPHAGDAAAYPVPPRLSYRAKVTIAALQSLLVDLTADPAGSAADVIAVIERRIDQLRT